MGATSSLCSGSKSVQVVNSTERRPDRLPGGDPTVNSALAPGATERTNLRLGNNVGHALTESEAKWIKQTNNNSTRTDHVSGKGHTSRSETETVDRRQQSNNRRKDDGCNLSVYDNLPGSLGKHGAWGDGLNVEGSSLRYSAYKSRDGLGDPEYVDGYLVNQNTDLNISDTSLLGSESCDSWHMGRKVVMADHQSCSSSSTSIQNPSLDNGNRSDQASMEATSKHSNASNGFSRNRKSDSQESLTNKDYDNLLPLGHLRPSHSDSGNLAVIGEVREGDINSSLKHDNNVRPNRIESAKCERVSNQTNVGALRQAKSLTLPLTSRPRPKSARKRDVSANREHMEERAQGHSLDLVSTDSEEDEMLSIPDETRGAGDNSDDLSDGLSGLGSTPDLTLEALDAFPDSIAPTPQAPADSTRVPQPRPPSFDIKSVLDDKGKSNIGKKGSERSISSIVITQAGEGKDSTEAKIRSLPPNTSLEEVGAMIAGDIIFRRSQGSMTQAEYQGIVKAYRIILEQLLAYQDGKVVKQSPSETAAKVDGENPSKSEQKEGDTKSAASPQREQDSSSDLEEKLEQVTEVFELEFAQKLVERGNGLTEADITQYLTEHAQNVKSVRTVLKTQKQKKDEEKQEAVASLPAQQQKRLGMLDEVARLLYLYSMDLSTTNADDIDQLCEAILESIASTPEEEENALEKEISAFGKQVDNAMSRLNDHFMQTVSDKRNEATAEELSQIIERHLIEETATVKTHESDRVKTINKNLSILGKTKEGFHVKVPELDGRPDDMNKKRRKLEQALKRILLGRKPIGEEEITDILDKYRREQRMVIEERDAQRLKRRDELKKKLVIPTTGHPKRTKNILKEMNQRYEESLKSKKPDKVSAAIHTMTAQKIVDSSTDLSRDRLTGLIREHQRRVAELENIRRREREKPVETHLDVVARDKAEDEKRNRERRIALNRATDVKQRAEDVLSSYRDATLHQHSLRPVHLPKSPNSIEQQQHDEPRHPRRRQVNDDTVPDSGYVDGMSVESTSVTPSLMTATPISSPGGDYSYLNNRLMTKKQDDAESVRAEDYETLELLVNDVIDQCVDDYSRAENLYSWLVSQEIPDTNSYANDGESPLFALSCIAKGQSSYADVFLDMARLAGLTCEKIGGITKTPDYSPGEDIFSDLYRHSWNAVFIDNRYFLLDASEGSRREKFFREHFFCTGPSVFALTHFPDNQRWQLMERLVTEEDFASALKVWPAMFVYDIRPLNSKSLIRTYDGKMCITFSVKNHSVLCHLEYAGPGPEVDPRGLAYHVDQHTNNVDNEESFHLTLPQEGVYFFTLLVNDPEDEIDLPVCQYRIDYQDELL